MLSWCGSCCQNGAQRNLCEGLEMRRSSMVETETASVERKRKTNGLVRTYNGSKSTGGKTWLLGTSLQIHWKCRRSVGICPRQHGLVAPCSKPWKLEAVCEMWKEPCIDGPGCLGDPCASGMTDAGAAWLTERRIVRDRFGEHLQLVWTSTLQLEWKFRGRMVLRDVQNGSSETWCLFDFLM